MDDAGLTDAWERVALGSSTTSEEHVRIAAVFVLRHGRAEAERRLVEGTRRNCEAAGAPGRYDEPLLRRWVAVVADALAGSGARDAEALLAAQPELRRSDLLGQPGWRRSTAT